MPEETKTIHDIESLCIRSHAISLEKGWVTAEGDPRSFSTITILNHSELSEALEDWRSNKKVDEKYYEVTWDYGTERQSKRTDIMSEAAWKEYKAAPHRTDDPDDPEGKVVPSAKPCGIPIELADFIIRICQFAGTNGLGTQLDSFCTSMPYQMTKDALFDGFLADAHYAVAMARFTKEMGGALFWYGQAVRMTFSFCENNGIDLWAAIDEKEAYNRTRPMKHGGKKV